MITPTELTGFVFAAGLGTRLRPITNTTPKPLVKVHGKPLLEYTLDFLIDLGVTKAILNTSHLREQFRTYAGEYKQRLNVHLSEEVDPLGHVGGMRKALNLISTPYIIAFNADTILRFDPEQLAPVLNKLGQSPAKYKLAIATYKSTSGTLGFNSQYDLVSIGSKQLQQHSRATHKRDAAGVYILNKQALNLIYPADGFMGIYGDDDLIERMANTDSEIFEFPLHSFKRYEVTSPTDLAQLNNLHLDL